MRHRSHCNIWLILGLLAAASGGLGCQGTRGVTVFPPSFSQGAPMFQALRPGFRTVEEYSVEEYAVPTPNDEQIREPAPVPPPTPDPISTPAPRRFADNRDEPYAAVRTPAGRSSYDYDESFGASEWNGDPVSEPVESQRKLIPQAPNFVDRMGISVRNTYERMRGFRPGSRFSASVGGSSFFGRRSTFSPRSSPEPTNFAWRLKAQPPHPAAPEPSRRSEPLMESRESWSRSDWQSDSRPEAVGSPLPDAQRIPRTDMAAASSANRSFGSSDDFANAMRDDRSDPRQTQRYDDWNGTEVSVRPHESNRDDRASSLQRYGIATDVPPSERDQVEELEVWLSKSSEASATTNNSVSEKTPNPPAAFRPDPAAEMLTVPHRSGDSVASPSEWSNRDAISDETSVPRESTVPGPLLMAP